MRRSFASDVAECRIKDPNKKRHRGGWRVWQNSLGNYVGGLRWVASKTCASEGGVISGGGSSGGSNQGVNSRGHLAGAAHGATQDLLVSDPLKQILRCNPS